MVNPLWSYRSSWYRSDIEGVGLWIFEIFEKNIPKGKIFWREARYR